MSSDALSSGNGGELYSGSTLEMDYIDNLNSTSYTSDSSEYIFSNTHGVYWVLSMTGSTASMSRSNVGGGNSRSTSFTISTSKSYFSSDFIISAGSFIQLGIGGSESDYFSSVGGSITLITTSNSIKLRYSFDGMSATYIYSISCKPSVKILAI